MDDIFKIVKGRLKQADPEREWQNYLVGKELILGTGFGDTWTLYGITGEPGMEDFMKYAWETEPEPREYGSLEDMIDDIEMGNYGFSFELDKIEVITTELSYDFDKGKNVEVPYAKDS